MVVGPTFCVEHLTTSVSTPMTSSSSNVDAEEGPEFHTSDDSSKSFGGRVLSGDYRKVARCLCITDKSLQPGLSTVLIIFPPNCEFPYSCTITAVALMLSRVSDFEYFETLGPFQMTNEYLNLLIPLHC